ncbi:PaaI family thioesterase [soil metagenome]
MQELGFVLTEINAGEVKGELIITEKHEQQNGFVHGGVISSLCDMACGFAAYSMVPEGVQVFTVELKVNYLRPGVGEKILAHGWVLKPGKRFHFCESELYVVRDGKEIMIAKASSTIGVVDDKVNDKYGG